MIIQTDAEFKRDVKHLIKMVHDTKGLTGYTIRTEIYDPKDPYGFNQISCGNCGTMVDLTHHCKWKTSGYIKYLDSISNTPCCGKTVDATLCPLVCVRCQRVAVFLTPHKNKRGFEYNPGKAYHLDSCSNCDGTPGMRSLIIEQIVYDKLNNTKP